MRNEGKKNTDYLYPIKNGCKFVDDLINYQVNDKIRI